MYANGIVLRLPGGCYFAGEAENQNDRWLNAAPHPERLIAALQAPAPLLESHALVARLDIVLANG
ncbi:MULTISPECIES: hypothetical protein [unclassified Bradyrhizobium]|uniref:hypothetical protein n=1 Tax=unclassified Bradyrhizobium TaxID=2631580 RepID=UPI003396B024